MKPRERKSFLKSKTFWVNIVAIFAGLYAQKTGVEVGAAAQVTILSFVNLVLRTVTKEPMVWDVVDDD